MRNFKGVTFQDGIRSMGSGFTREPSSSKESCERGSFDLNQCRVEMIIFQVKRFSLPVSFCLVTF